MTTNTETTATQREGTEILIVDDAFPVRRLLANFTLKAGFQPIEVEGSRHLHEIPMRIRNVPVAFVDFQLEEETGADVARYLRRLNPDIVVVLISGTQGVDLAEEARQIGATFFLTKPFNYAVFRVVLENALLLHRRQRRARQAQELARTAVAALRRAARRWARESELNLADTIRELDHRLRKLLDADLSLLLLRRNHPDVWQVLINSHDSRAHGAKIAAMECPLEKYMGRDRAFMLPEADPCRKAAYFRHFRGYSIVGMPLELPFARRRLTWLFVRRPNRHPFGATDLPILDEVQPTLTLALDTPMAIVLRRLGPVAHGQKALAATA